MALCIGFEGSVYGVSGQYEDDEDEQVDPGTLEGGPSIV
jgi:hypothetical protein